jgi:hypothetical protein
MADQNSDDKLLERLKALKPTTSVSLDAEPKIHAYEEDELAARFRGLASGTRTAATTSKASHEPAQEDLDFGDEENLDDLLKDLGVEQSWALDAAPKRSEVDDLLREANELLPDTKEQGASSKSEDSRPSQNEEIERDTVDVVQQALEEAEAAKESDPEAHQEEEEDGDEDEDEDEDVPFELPSVPSAPPSGPGMHEAESSNADHLASRFASLNLPTIPQTAPGVKTTVSKANPKSSLKTPTDEEIESWCIICCEDATVRCLGCDGDLYCTGCWKEGHLSKDAGYEERRHKAVAYNKPDGKKKQGSKKVLLGA